MQQLTGRASMGCCSTRAQFSRVGQGTSAVMFDNQLTLQGEWRGWRSSRPQIRHHRVQLDSKVQQSLGKLRGNPLYDLVGCFASV